MTPTLNDAIISLILLFLMVLFFPIIFIILLWFSEKVLCPFWNWYLDKLGKLWDKIKGDVE